MASNNTVIETVESILRIVLMPKAVSLTTSVLCSSVISAGPSLNILLSDKLTPKPWYSLWVQSLSRVRLFVTPWTAAHQASLSITNSRSVLKLMSIELVMPSSHLILCHPLLLLPSVFSSIRVFSSESVLHITGPKYWSFNFSIRPSSEYSRLISFWIDWLDLLAVQGTLKSLLQHHSSKVFISWALSFPYRPTLTSIHDYWKNHKFD